MYASVTLLEFCLMRYFSFSRVPHLGRSMDLKIERKHYKASVSVVSE